MDTPYMEILERLKTLPTVKTWRSISGMERQTVSTRTPNPELSETLMGFPTSWTETNV